MNRTTGALSRLLAAAIVLAATTRAAPPKPLVIPFDFRSEFDAGATGQAIGDMVWTKLKATGGFVLPESMQEVRDWCERNQVHPGAESPLDAMRKAVQVEQAGDIGIWGAVERVPGTQLDAYDLTIVIVDFRPTPPRVVFRKASRTRTVSEIPHVHIKEAIEALSGRVIPAPVEAGGPLKGSIKGANLVRGDFETGQPGPAGWDPLTTWVRRRLEPGTAKNHVLHFEIPEDVAASTGVLYYSDFFPITPGATYRFHCRWRTTGSAAKVFIKGYDDLPGPFARPGGTTAEVARREVYRSQQNLVGRPNTWNEHTEDFTPRHARFTPRWARVMLYGYWPAGSIEWDDVSVVPVSTRAGR